jgi:hypothetical protein
VTKVGFWRNDEGLSPIEDFLASLARIVGEKRRIADQHFEQNNPQTPPVNSFSITRFAEDFRSYIIRCTNRRVGKFAIAFKVLVLPDGQLKAWFFGLFWLLFFAEVDFLLANFRVFAKSEVREFDMALNADEDIVRFEISVYIIKLMH